MQLPGCGAPNAKSRSGRKPKVARLRESARTGRIAERFGARWLLIAGMAVCVSGLLMLHFVHGLVAVFIAAARIGSQSSTYNGSLQNLNGLLSTPETRARSLSNDSLVTSTGNPMGPLIAGFSVNHTSHALAPVLIASISVTPQLMFTRSGEGVGLQNSFNHFTRIVFPMIFGAIATATGMLSIFWLNAVLLGAGGILSRPKESQRPDGGAHSHTRIMARIQ